MSGHRPPCHIHIGAPKTGSTFLQQFLHENREALQSRGLLYPDVSLRGFGHHDLAFLLAGGYPEWATPQAKGLAELAAGLRQATERHAGPVLLSSEDFYLLPAPERLRALLDEVGLLASHRPAILVYVRRQDDAHESWYNQTVKAQGYTHTLDECVAAFEPLWDYGAQLSRWAAAFGEESVVVRPYEASQFVGGSLLLDFAHHTGIDLADLKTPPEGTNGRLNRDVLEFQRHLNRLPTSHREKRRFHRDLITLSAAAAGTGLFDERPLLDPGRRRAILARYEEGNAEVAARYLRQPALFVELPPDEAGTAPRGVTAPPEPMAPPGLTIEKLVAIVGWLIARRVDQG